MDVKRLLTDGEAIYHVTRFSGRTISMIGPQVEDIRSMDLSGCIEDTFHRLLDAGAKDSDILEILDAENCGLQDEEEGDCYIDQGYVIKNFQPAEVLKTGIVFERPVYTYMVQTEIQIPDDPLDEEILQAAAKCIGIDPQYHIVESIDDRIFMIRSLISGRFYTLSKIQEV